MGSRFSITPPADYVLARDACSYGYFLLEPNHWDPRSRTFSRVLDLPSGPVRIAIRQEGDTGRVASGRGGALRVAADRAISRLERALAAQQITRMLRLDEPHEVIRDFHKRDPRYRRTGRGRLMRSPTLFEDVIKTVTSCNVTWPSTVIMNRRLCEVVGRAGEFPSPRRLARTRAGTLRARCRVGYRDRRILDLAAMFASGELDPRWFESPATPDDAVYARLIELPGIGPYAAANIMQLLGRYSRLPMDTETIRHAKLLLGFRGTARKIMTRVARHYAPFGPHAFRSYWFELWDFYEAKRGPAWTWEREKTASTFTAAQF